MKDRSDNAVGERTELLLLIVNTSEIAEGTKEGVVHAGSHQCESCGIDRGRPAQSSASLLVH
jgi:hypothetical protein